MKRKILSPRLLAMRAVMAVVCLWLASLSATSQTIKKWYLVTDAGARFSVKSVGTLVASDDQPTFSVLSVSGTVLADEVTEVTFDQREELVPTSVPQVLVDNNQLSRPIENELTLMGFRGTVTVYTSGGQQVLRQSNTSGDLTLDVSSLSPGLYVVRAGTMCFKFLKK
jgi:hypothetical protein